MNEFIDQLFFGGYFKHQAEMQKNLQGLFDCLLILFFLVSVWIGMMLQRTIYYFDKKRKEKEEKVKDSGSYQKRIKLT
jgi:hypothetical protein